MKIKNKYTNIEQLKINAVKKYIGLHKYAPEEFLKSITEYIDPNDDDDFLAAFYYLFGGAQSTDDESGDKYIEISRFATKNNAPVIFEINKELAKDL